MTRQGIEEMHTKLLHQQLKLWWNSNKIESLKYCISISQDSKYGDSALYCTIPLYLNACISSIVTYKVPNLSSSSEHQLSKSSSGSGDLEYLIDKQICNLRIGHTKAIVIIQSLGTPFDQS
jgi:hypothetical protein